MANLKSSKKDVRRSQEKATVNKSVRTALKTTVKKVRLAVEGGDKKQIDAAISASARSMDKAAQRGIIHKNQAARRKSRAAKLANKKPE